jgi:ammonia channel protein AmtB
MINTFTATAGAILAWTVIETLHRGKASLLGAVSGMIAGLVAVTPGCGICRARSGAIAARRGLLGRLLLFRRRDEEQVRL